MTPYEVRERVYDLCADLEFEDAEENGRFLRARDDTLFEAVYEAGPDTEIADTKNLEALLQTLAGYRRDGATGGHWADIIDQIAEELGTG